MLSGLYPFENQRRNPEVRNGWGAKGDWVTCPDCFAENGY